MVNKKDDARFTIKFNPDIPRHQEAIRILSEAGRAKAALIADALHLCSRNNGRITTVVVNDEMYKPVPISNVPNAVKVVESSDEARLTDEDLWQTVGKSVESFFS